MATPTRTDMNNNKYSNVLQMGDEDFQPFVDQTAAESNHQQQANTMLDAIPTSQILARRVGQISPLNQYPLMIRRYSNQGDQIFGDDGLMDQHGMEPRSAPLRNLRVQMGLNKNQDMSPGLKTSSPLHHHQGMPRTAAHYSHSPGLPRANMFSVPTNIGIGAHPQGMMQNKQPHYSHFGQGIQNLSNSNSPTYIKPQSSRMPNMNMNYDPLGPMQQSQPQEVSMFNQRQPGYSPLYPAPGRVGTVMEGDEYSEEYDGDNHTAYSIEQIAQILFKSGDQKQLLNRLEEEKEFFESVYRYLMRQFPQCCKDNELVQLCIKIISLCGDEGERITRIVNSLDNKVVGLCKDACATRVLQRLIEKISRHKSLVSKLSSQIKGHVSSLVMCSNGNHVIQKLITLVDPEDIGFIYEEILSEFKAIGVHKHGCCCKGASTEPLMYIRLIMLDYRDAS
jgi:Pumilio-family RNA binding repeat